MEAVGRLAGGVAHDFNNLLTAIIGYSDFLLMKMEQGDSSRQHVEEIKKAGERAASLTRQLLAFSRKQVLQPKVLDLNNVVAENEKMLARLVGEDIELKTSIDPKLGHVKADPGQIEQVLINLVANARDAMPRGGRLAIKTSNVVLDEAESGRLPAGSYVMLTVRDTGRGMDEETQSHIFEPFFTTKDQHEGAGLGLSTVYGIVSQSGGEIRVESEPGRGATFNILLPRVDEPVEAEAARSSFDPTTPAVETVLLVEDEEAVRKLVREVLSMNGYSVLEAANGKDALRICGLHGRPIDLMITDVVMPHMGGRELAERMRRLRPSTKVLYVSGHTEDATLHRGVSDKEMNFLQKPFTPLALIGKVREVLEPKQSASFARAASACAEFVAPVNNPTTATFPDTDPDSFETIH
jgi:CheY-like chemotaxis protein